MSKYRFKTKEEFIRDGLWHHVDDVPINWNSDKEMNHYMGQDVPERFNEKCEYQKELEFDGWLFRSCDYVLKEQYFDDLSQHIGRYLKALVNAPNAGDVKKGEYGKIITPSYANFPNHKKYACTTALTKGSLGVLYELMPEGFDPYKEEDLYGRYLKALVDTPQRIGKLKKGDYIKVISKSLEGNCTLEDDYYADINESTIGNIWEVMPEGFVPNETECVDTKHNFVPGNWYYYNKHYVKYSHHDGYVWVGSEYIYEGKHTYSHRFTCGANDDEKIEVALSEIQHYLPDGHPDKHPICEQNRKYLDAMLSSDIDFSELELEDWLRETKKLNLSLDELEDHIGYTGTCNYNKVYCRLEGHFSNNKAEVLYDEWNKDGCDKAYYDQIKIYSNITKDNLNPPNLTIFNPTKTIVDLYGPTIEL